MLVVRLPARFPLRFLIALALGALHAASFVADDAWPIELAALAGLVALAIRAARGDDRPGHAAFAAARLGFAFGLGWFGVGVSWIYISLHDYGELAAPLAAAAVFAFCAYLALFPALACAAFAASTTRWPRLRAPLAAAALFAALWTLSEMARGTLFTGFPWLAVGYAHVGGPLAGFAPVVGVYGVTLVAALVAAALALAARRDVRLRRGAGAALFATVVLALAAGQALGRIDWTQPTGRPISVRLLQGDVAQDIKFDEASFAGIADAYLDAIERKPADLIVLPETAFPVFLADLPDTIAARLARDARDLPAAIAFGIPIEEKGDRYFNSVLALEPPVPGATEPKRAQRYDKSHLVPFGEFVPTGFHWFMRLINMPLGDFTRGSIDQQPMTLAGLRVAFNICYEDLFGETIIRQAGTANVLVNVSNVAWFGDSMALPQHLDISRMRSIETGRPMLRATNTGMTASIDPHGRVLASLKPFTVGSLDVDVQGMTGLTPYLRFGDATSLAAIALCLLVALFAGRRQRAIATR